MSTDREWESWGKLDPYYGVLSHDKFKTETIEQHRDEFFGSGVANIQSFFERFEKCFGPLRRGSALDFGCGVGRLTLALAGKFGNVVGIDVSESMLAEARSNARKHGIDNATFAHSIEFLQSDSVGAFDFVLSYIVLQHIPPNRGTVIMNRLLELVAPGGGCMLHFSLKRHETFFRRMLYWSKFNLPFVQGATNLLKGRPWRFPAMQMNEYRLDRVLEIFERHEMREVRAFVEKHGSAMTVGVLALKPAKV